MGNENLVHKWYPWVRSEISLENQHTSPIMQGPGQRSDLTSYEITITV